MASVVESNVPIRESVCVRWPHHDAMPTSILPYCIAWTWFSMAAVDPES